MSDLFSWTPTPTTAEILPFPLRARTDFVRRHAAIIAGLTLEGADLHLRRQMTRQASVLASKGIAVAVVEREVGALRRAILERAGRLIAGGGIAIR